MRTPVKIGIVGCGVISGSYIKRLQATRAVEVYACADIDLQRAQAKAAEFGIPHAYTPAEILSDPDVQIVVNLTLPQSHAAVTLSAIEAGKHVYTEKPLGVSREEAAAILQSAQKHSVMVCSAPDTFLQPNIQTLRQVIDSGQLGEVVGGHAVFMSPGHEAWHPGPDFYYQVGGGPLMDMGPYYLCALVNALGPIKRVLATSKMSFAERTITARTARNGEKIRVEVPTHVAGILIFENNAMISLTTSFDVCDTAMPDLELNGTRGTITLGRYGTHVGTTPVRVKLAGHDSWSDAPQGHQRDLKFGVGIVDMADALINNRPPRASAELAVHILDVLKSLEEAAVSGCAVEVSSTCARPDVLDERLLERMD